MQVPAYNNDNPLIYTPLHRFAAVVLKMAADVVHDDSLQKWWVEKGV